MTHYVTIRRGKKDHVVAGPFESKQRARLVREKYFFTGYDEHCDATPDRQTISHGHSYPISCCSVQQLPEWRNGSLHGVTVENLPNVDPGNLF